MSMGSVPEINGINLYLSKVFLPLKSSYCKPYLHPCAVNLPLTLAIGRLNDASLNG